MQIGAMHCEELRPLCAVSVQTRPPVACGPWLTPHILREVTDDPVYQNYELALRLSKKP